MARGDWVVLDGLNRARPALLSFLLPLLEPTSKAYPALHPRFRLFATTAEGSPALPQSLQSRALRLFMDPGP